MPIPEPNFLDPAKEVFSYCLSGKFNANILTCSNIYYELHDRCLLFVYSMLQVLNMTNDEKDLMSRHLAHNLKTHDAYYRQCEASLSLAKVSRLLIAVEDGQLDQFKGKTMEEVEIDGE